MVKSLRLSDERGMPPSSRRRGGGRQVRGNGREERVENENEERPTFGAVLEGRVMLQARSKKRDRAVESQVVMSRWRRERKGLKLGERGFRRGRG